LPRSIWTTDQSNQHRWRRAQAQPLGALRLIPLTSIREKEAASWWVGCQGQIRRIINIKLGGRPVYSDV
jgi:hypothetical protein